MQAKTDQTPIKREKPKKELTAEQVAGCPNNRKRDVRFVKWANLPSGRSKCGIKGI